MKVLVPGAHMLVIRLTNVHLERTMNLSKCIGQRQGRGYSPQKKLQVGIVEAMINNHRAPYPQAPGWG